jgi:diguanylate cyclase (GGDEF)-like protein
MNMPVTPPMRAPAAPHPQPLREVLDGLCPMHLLVSPTGIVTHAGPTLRKMCGDAALLGRPFLEVFDLHRPRNVTAMADLRSEPVQRLHLRLHAPPRTALKGVMLAMGDGAGTLVVNLSFGISIMDGVRDFALTNADFAATDLAIEMLYLIEAKTAALDASRRLNQRLQGAKVEAEEAALTDTLTGLRNRRAMDQALGRLVQGPAPFAVMHVDLDYFKRVNDTLGHAAGDHVLRVVSQVMVEEIRHGDIAARVGGDEFTLLLAQVKSPDVLDGIGQRIIDRIEQPIPFGGEFCRISASIGTIWIDGNARPNVADLLGKADIALYASKHAGRGRHTLYTDALDRRATAATDPVPTPEDD